MVTPSMRKLYDLLGRSQPIHATWTDETVASIIAHDIVTLMGTDAMRRNRIVRKAQRVAGQPYPILRAPDNGGPPDSDDITGLCAAE